MSETRLERLLSTDEAAAYLGLPKGTLAKWRCEGRGPAWVHVGRYVKYAESAIRDYLVANTTVPGDAA